MQQCFRPLEIVLPTLPMMVSKAKVQNDQSGECVL